MIEVKNVSKTFYPGTRKEQKVLENASLNLPDKGLVCLVGPSGSGKSTILNAIGGLISYDGRILYDGNEEKIEEYRRNHIGYIFQDFLLFENLSIRDNIKIGLNLASVYEEKEVSRRTEILLKAVSLNVNSSRLVKNLSLGQKQRVGIARALANSPKILLADEPTGNLDSKNSLRILDILKGLSKDRLVLIVTHNMSLVNLYADQAFRIENSGFVEFNPKGEKVSPVYEEETKNISYHKEASKIGYLNISFYSEEEQGERKITIVERNGKLLISGENIALASKEEIEPLVKSVDSNPSVSREKKESVSSIDSTNEAERKEDTSLSFEPRHDKKPLKDRSFFLSLFHRNPLSQTKYKGKTSFKVIEVLLPLVAFFFFNLYYASIDTSSKLLPTYYLEDNMIVGHYTKEKEEEIRSDPSKAFSISLDDYLSWSEEDSGILSAPFESPLGSKSGQSITYGKDSPLKVPDFYLHFASSDTYAYRSDYPLSSTIPQGVFSLEDYKTFFPDQLSQYRLASDEVLVDVSLLTKEYKAEALNAKDTTLTFFDNIDSKELHDIEMERIDLTPYLSKAEYKVKGFVDTGLQAIYSTKEVAQKAKMLSLASVPSNYYSYDANYLFAPDIACFPSLKNTSFYRYEDTSSDSDLVYKDLSSQEGTDQSTYVEGLSQTLYNALPYIILSDSAKEDWNLLASSDNSYFYSPAFLMDKGSVSSGKDSTKKIMVFKKSLFHNKTLDSYSEFYRYLVVEKLLSNFKVDSSYDEAEKDSKKVILHLPKGLSDAFKGATFIPQQGEASAVFSTDRTYSNELDYGSKLENIEIGSSVEGASIDDPIVLSRTSYLRFLAGLKYLDSVLSLSLFDTNGTLNSTQVSYRQGNFFLSKNPSKSISYLNSKYQDQGVIFETAKSVKETLAYQQLVSDVRIYLIVLLVLFLLFILFTVLNDIGKINSLRYNIGVERCLGMTKREVILDCLGDTLANFLWEALLPTLLFSLILALVGLYFCGVKILLFLLFDVLIEVLSVLIPLLILLGKKPADILRSLN